MPVDRGRVVSLGRPRILRSLLTRPSWPLQVAWHHQPELETAVRRTVADFRPDVAVLMLSRLGWLLPALDGLPVVVDLVDSLALNMRQRAAREPLLSALWRCEAARIERWDRRLLSRVARATVVSERDRAALVSEDNDPTERVEVLPFGIRLPRSPSSDSENRRAVLLSGNLGYFPTRDGARWLAREVWPRVKSRAPDAQWWLAGSRVPWSLRRLGRRDGIRVLSDPEDLSAVRRRCAAAVAPMRSGSGTPIKILEAMADGLPVVATPEAAAGLDGLAGDELSIARDSRSFARQLLRLLGDRESARLQAAAAWSWLRERHHLPRVARCFESLLEEVVDEGE